MKVALKELLAKLTAESIHVKKWSIPVTVISGAQGNYYNLSDAQLPTGAEVVALVLQSTPADGWITGTVQVIGTQAYVGLYNHYSTSLSGYLGISVFYTL